MATLNGTQIDQTYKGLIKITDNGIAGGSLKELTDGFGNGIGLFVNTSGDLTAQGDVIVQGTIDATGGNKIAFYYADQTSFPSASTYHGAMAHSHADGKMYFAHAGAWVEIANSSDITATSVDDVTIELDATNGLQVMDDAITTDKILDANVTSDKIADDSISYSKLSNEFTTGSIPTSTSGVSNLDFDASQVFTMTLTEDTAFTFSNDNIGMVKDLVLTGDFVPTFPTGSKIIAGAYSGTVSNFIQIIKTNTTEYWISISKEAI
jgi:hypothetical protein